jgi:hypothetical protein
MLTASPLAAFYLTAFELTALPLIYPQENHAE